MQEIPFFVQRLQLFRSREQVVCRGGLVGFHLSVAEVGENAGLALLDLHESQAYSERALLSSPWLMTILMSGINKGKESRGLEVTELGGGGK